MLESPITEEEEGFFRKEWESYIMGNTSQEQWKIHQDEWHLSMKNVTVILLLLFFSNCFISWYGCWLLKDYVNILSKKKKNDYVNISYGARRTTKLDVMNYYTVYGGAFDDFFLVNLRLMTFLSRIYSRGMHLKKYILAECFFFFFK